MHTLFIRRAQLLTGALLLSLLFWATPVQSRPQFEGEPLDTIGDKGWSELEFGVSTLATVKKNFDVSSSDLPNSTQFKQGKRPPREVHMMWGKEGKKSPLVAIALNYAPGQELELSQLQAQLKQKGQSLYARQRFEEWRVQTFPDKGVIAWVKGKDKPRVSFLMMVPSGQLRAWQRNQPLRVAATPVAVRVDPNANKPRIIEFGSTLVTFTFSGPYTMREQEKERQEDELKRRKLGGILQYRRGMAGSYDIDVGGSWKYDKGGTLNVTCTISGEGPYGPIRVSQSSSKTLNKALNGQGSIFGMSEGNLNYNVALAEAQSGVERKAKMALDAQGPPSLSTLRQQAWDKMIAELRTTAPAAK